MKKVISTGEIPSPVISSGLQLPLRFPSPWTSASVWTRSRSEWLRSHGPLLSFYYQHEPAVETSAGIGSIGITTADDGRQTTDKGRTISI